MIDIRPLGEKTVLAEDAVEGETMLDRAFDIPVAIFIFKRDKAVDIVKRISCVKPQKLYILADQGRNDEEKAAVAECRRAVEAAIDWDCEVIKNYAEENRGVYENIAEGAKWVLKKEPYAIFLEDDNLPEISFFPFCKEMLERYKDDERVLWICGTNYLGDYEQRKGYSYVFTHHMLPCGWASWSHKFEKYYDGALLGVDDPEVMKRVKRNYLNGKIYRQYRDSFMREYRRMRSGRRPVSWDYQMDFSIKANNLFGICPTKNQIKNIGVDDCSVHGGNDFAAVMTQRFCGMDSYPIKEPLRHPDSVEIDPTFEKKIGKIILHPFSLRFKGGLNKLLRKILRVPADRSLSQYIRNGFK